MSLLSQHRRAGHRHGGAACRRRPRARVRAVVRRHHRRRLPLPRASSGPASCGRTPPGRTGTSSTGSPTRTSLARWERSPERAEWLRRAEDLVEETGVSHGSSGLETWFAMPGRTAPAPPRWKMSLVTLVAIVPLVLLMNLLVLPLLWAGRWSRGPRLLRHPDRADDLGRHPRVTRLFRRFLYGGRAPSAEEGLSRTSAVVELLIVSGLRDPSCSCSSASCSSWLLSACVAASGTLEAGGLDPLAAEGSRLAAATRSQRELVRHRRWCPVGSES